MNETDEYVETVESSEDIESSSSERDIYTDIVNVYVSGSSEAEESVEETQAAETGEPEPEYLSDLESEPAIRLLGLDRANRSSESSRSLPDIKNLWTVTFGNTEYKVIFPAGAEIDIIDGKLVNRGSSNITGVVLGNSFSDSDYFERTITLLPLTSSNTQNSVYRYGSRSYLTTYSNPTQGYNLVTNVSYGPVDLVDKPLGWKYSPEAVALICIALGLLIVNFIGGLVRR